MQAPPVEENSGQRRFCSPEERAVLPPSKAYFEDQMAALIDLPEVRARLSRLSVKAYEALDAMGALDKQAELIRGMIVKKMPKSPLHCKLVRRVFFFLLALQRAGWTVFMERPLRLVDSMPEPDIVIVRGEVEEFDTHHPTTAALAIEIAVSSVVLDREKAPLYAEAGVEEYWIVLAEENRIEAYTRPEGGHYQDQRTYSVGETLRCMAIPDLQVSLAEWFA